MTTNGQTLNGLPLLLGGEFCPCEPPELYERCARGCWRRNEDGDCVTARREEDCVVEEACRLKADRKCCCCWRSRLEAGTRELLRISCQAWREGVAAIVRIAFQGVPRRVSAQ